MFKKKNILSLLLAAVILMSNTLVAAQEVLPAEVIPDSELGAFDSGLSIPERNASFWALNELVDSDRYGLYSPEDLYQMNLRIDLNDEFKNSLLEDFQDKLVSANLEKIEKPEFVSEIKDSKSRGNFLKEVYNLMLPYEKEENLGKDPIMYLNHSEILLGDGGELYLDRAITTEEAVIFVKRAVDYIYSENKIDSQGLMWKVENKGNTVYLLGAIHYGETDLYPFRKEVINNFSESEALFVEIDITNQEELMKIMMEKMEELEEESNKDARYEDSSTLKSAVDEETYLKIEKIMEKNNIAEEEYIDYKVSGVTQKIMEIYLDEAFSEELEDIDQELQEELDAEFENEMEELMDNELMQLIIEGPKLGVDFYFLDKAKTTDKKVGELESIKDQIDLLFDGGLFGEVEELSEEEEFERLEEILSDFDEEGNVLKPDKSEDQSFSEEELKFQEDFEEEMNEALDDQLEIIKGMFEAIKSGDVEMLAGLFSEAEEEEILGGQLLGERDKQMAEKISKLLEGDEEKVYFVVVGAAHFVVDGTIIDNLNNSGYAVERIK